MYISWYTFLTVASAFFTLNFVKSKAKCLSFVHTVTMARAMELKHNSSLISALANETSKLFSDAAKVLDPLGEVVSQWTKYLRLKAAVYQAYVCFVPYCWKQYRLNNSTELPLKEMWNCNKIYLWDFCGSVPLLTDSMQVLRGWKYHFLLES